MEMFNCRYENHENEEIIGLCLYQNCQKATQYCYQCLTQTHTDHQNDCIQFITMNLHINQFIQVHKESNSKINEIINQMKNCFEQMQKQMDQDIKILEDMNKKLLNKDYSAFNQQITLIKSFYSKEKEQQICINFCNSNRTINNLIYTKQLNIIEFNQILNTIKNIVSVYTKINKQVNTDNENTIKVKEIEQICEELMNENSQKAKTLYDLGQIYYTIKQGQNYFHNQGKVSIVKNDKYKEALNLFDASIKLFDQDYDVYLYKGLALVLHLFDFYLQYSKINIKKLLRVPKKLFLLILNMIWHGCRNVIYIEIILFSSCIISSLIYSLFVRMLNKHEEAIEWENKWQQQQKF